MARLRSGARRRPPGPRQCRFRRRDLLTINYTSGTTSRPKGVMITHRNAWMNCIGTLLHLPMTSADRYLWTLPMFHANGWTFVWTVTAVGATHVCLRKVDPALVFELARRERITTLCAAPTVLIGLANLPADRRGDVPAGLRVLTAGAPPAAATIARIEGEVGWTVTQVYGLTETSPFITVCEPRPEHAGLSGDERAAIKARQGVELVTSGEVRVVDETGCDVPRDGETMGEIVARGNVVMAGYYNDPERHRGGDSRRLVPHRRRRRRPSRSLHRDPRPVQGRDHQRRREHLVGGDRRDASAAFGGARGRGGGARGSRVGRVAARVRRPAARRRGVGRGARVSSLASDSRTSRCRARSTSSRLCRRPPPARSRSTCCAKAAAPLPGNSGCDR